ncbi:MAG: TRAP transporter small permease, partial [Alphaproteobacteria bacterium]|nr:TRAP transporter small permease [Alphaproteobacteria bacterium]
MARRLPQAHWRSCGGRRQSRSSSNRAGQGLRSDLKRNREKCAGRGLQAAPGVFLTAYSAKLSGKLSADGAGGGSNMLDRFLRGMALAAGGVLLLLTFLTVVDVVLRYFFNAPFRGSLELTEYAMALIVFFSLAYAGWTGAHIAVDLLEKWLDRPSLRFLPSLMAFAGAVL